MSKYSMTICKAVSLRVRELLQVNKFSQYRLEQNSGVSHSAMDFIMKNIYQTVNLKIVVQIAHGFQMTLLDFLDSPYFEYDNLDLE
jgi:transcriptional regulator with XRE-family HTH domain